MLGPLSYLIRGFKHRGQEIWCSNCLARGNRVYVRVYVDTAQEHYEARGVSGLSYLRNSYIYTCLHAAAWVAGCVTAGASCMQARCAQQQAAYVSCSRRRLPDSRGMGGA